MGGSSVAGLPEKLASAARVVTGVKASAAALVKGILGVRISSLLANWLLSHILTGILGGQIWRFRQGPIFFGPGVSGIGACSFCHEVFRGR